MNPLVIFSDLDGTLLDHHSYRFDDAIDTLEILKEHAIPCILNTSKTYAELKQLNQRLNLSAPFIVENGAAIYFPSLSVFNQRSFLQDSGVDQVGDYLRKPFGPNRHEILARLRPLKSQFSFTGFADMDVQALIDATQLSEESAKLALEREYTEPLIWQDSEEAFRHFQHQLAQHGLQTQRGGRFIHVMGKHCDKAFAMQWLTNYFETYYQRPVTTMALGDGGNDVAMINEADIGIVIRSPAHPPPAIPNKKNIDTTDAYGPTGWSEAINKELQIRELI